MKKLIKNKNSYFNVFEFDFKMKFALLVLCMTIGQIQASEINITDFDNELKQSQGVQISGAVTDSNGQPLPGANIIEKGTKNGAQSDFDGKFSLNVTNANSILVVSYIGFKTQEVALNGKTTINITLQEDAAALDEVVVVGYGTQKRSDITGSVVSVPKDRLENLPVTNVLQAIQGTTAGLNIAQSSSVPGSSASVQVRGINSINAGNSPLIILDGIPFFGVTNDINTNDVESIEVLKDASAVAIYGTRGSNGVILITTKRGKQSDGKPIVKYSGYAGVEAMANPLTPMGPDAYVQKYADFLTANGLSQTAVLPNASEVENYDAGITTDWLGEATRSGFIQEHNISLSNASEKSQYYISAAHLEQNGVVKGYNFKKNTFRFNADSEVTDWLKIGTSAFFSENNYSGGRANFLEATAMSPYSVPKDENGAYIIYPMSPELLFRNPLLGLTTDREDIARNLTGTGFLELAPIKGLTYRMNASYTYNWGNFKSYSGRAADDQSGTGFVSNSETGNWVIENILTYAKDIDKHHFDVTALYGAQKVDYFQSESRAVGFVNDGLSYYDLASGTTQSVNSQGNEYTLVSQMGRINYSYDSRYLLTLTARRDGYSAFGANTDKIGVFPSVAIGWNIKNESFLEDSNFVNALKIRFSHGKTGNQAIDVNQTATTATSVRFPFNGTVLTGVRYNNIGNPNLNWESTTSSNIGVDFGFLKNRISGTVEVYQSKTEDILLRRNLPNITGYANIWSNLGSMENKGLEVTLNTVNIDTEDFSWKSSINFSTYRNEILDLYGDGQDDIGNRWFIGESLRVFYDYEKEGIWQEGEDIASVDPVAQPGDIKFKDQNGDGKIDNEDRVILGRTTPDWVGGFTNTFRYKNFNLSIFIQTSQGGLKSNRDLTYADEAGRRNLPADFRYWTPENKDNYWPSLSAYKNYKGYAFPEDYSYVRIKDVRLSYVFPSSILEKIGVNALTIYAAGRNLHTFTKWYGWDPEVTYFSRGSSDNSGGSWTNNYPTTKTISLGLNVTL
ncbi:TonB dependent receptor [Mariniflexile rhizosphaerae]|uniref:SusC/RagA family TonB-linked outer membrane protein n=1 Tax=unclassified Mariniflexile TaxID=2643887 RepID=UPI000CAD7AA6|nr:TonB-dependent receptor [Mariniflexile sp. TRM1-10]AXP82066.1 TonB dependent receptor [Mariniflexile sp. TRM1-10]PLB20294.1 MAG: TonB-linked outer membrane protein, SusC/RagA family [Flavobacteriaceae bacterium FS1-H7996/R]